MFCFVEQLCIPDCGEVAKKAEAEAVLTEGSLYRASFLNIRGDRGLLSSNIPQA